MKNLLAQKIDGRWKRVCFFRMNRKGQASIPMRCRGQITGHVIKTAASFLAVETAAVQLDYEIQGRAYRVTRL